MKVIFFSLLPLTPTFLSRPVSYIKNSSKTLVNLTKFATEKNKYVTATGFNYLI